MPTLSSEGSKLGNLGKSDMVGRFLNPTKRSVHVVAHENIIIDLEAVSLSILLQPFQLILAIGITPKDHLSLIATADHVVKGDGVFDPWFSSHSGFLSPSTGNNAI